MADLLTDFGEEYWQRASTGDLTEATTWEIGIYNDSTDTITDSDDVAAITTEPGNTNYARQSVTASNITFAQESGDVVFDVPNVTFDLTDNASGNSFDSWFIVIPYTSNIVGSDGSDTDHLVMTGSLSTSYTGSSTGNLQVNDIKGSLT